MELGCVASITKSVSIAYGSQRWHAFAEKGGARGDRARPMWMQQGEVPK